MEAFLTRGLLRHNIYLALGFGVGLVVARRIKKPVRSLLVSAACGALNLSDRVTSMTGSVKEEFKSIMEEAREEVSQKRMGGSEAMMSEAVNKGELPAEVIEPVVHEPSAESDRTDL